MRIGASTTNSRGGFSGNRPPRSTGAPFGNNSPIRLNLGTSAGNAAYDGGSAPHYDPGLSHSAQPMAHPLPPYHPSPQPSNTAPHYPQAPFNNPDSLYPHYPSNPVYPPGGTNDPPNPNMGGHTRGPNESMRNNNFHPDFGSGVVPGYNNAPPQAPNETYNVPMGGQSSHGTGSHRSGRGGFRGNSGTLMPGGRGSRERGNDAAGEAATPRGSRTYPHQSFGSSNKSDRHGSGNRVGRHPNGSSSNRHDDHGSNYGGGGGAGGGNSRHSERPIGPNNRGQRNISSLPPMAGGFHKGNQHPDRRSGGGGNNRSAGGLAERGSGNRNGRRNNGRDAKFEDRKNHRAGRAGGSGAHPPNGPGVDKPDKAKQSGGPAGVRVKNGWGAQFKEFSEREKDKEKIEETTTPIRRTLTDFRINALEIPDLSWSWMADNPDIMNEISASAIVSNLEKIQSKSNLSAASIKGSATGKHGRDEDADATDTRQVSAPGDVAQSSSAAPSNASKKVKSEATAEMGKKIYEEAATAVKGLNLTVDEHSSDHEGSTINEEIKDQLLSGSNPELPDTHFSNCRSVSTLIGDGQGPNCEVHHPGAEATSPDDPKKVTSPQATTATSNPPTKVVQPSASSLAPGGPQAQARDRAHPHSKPTLPAGRENSRLRLYFSSPPNEATVSSNPAGLPNKPFAAPGVGKRRLSISGHSAMSVDTKIGGGARGSSPANNTSPSKGTVPKSNLKNPKQTSEAQPRTLGSHEAMTKNSPRVEAPVASTPGDPETVEIGKPDSSLPNIEIGSASGDVKPDEPIKTTGNTTEERAGGEPTLIEISDDDADADYEDEDNEDDEYESPPVPEPQADRLSISYARNTRRMVIDSDVVESIKVFRGEHKIEVLVRLSPALIQGGKFDGVTDEYRICKGVLVEALDQEIDDYVIIDRRTLEAAWKTKEKAKWGALDENNVDFSTEAKDCDEATPSQDGDHVAHDPLLPPLHCLFLSCLQAESMEDGFKPDDEEIKAIASDIHATPAFKQNTVLIIAKLDTVNPLTEAKWVRTGDVDSWISQMTGRIFKPEEKSECGWRRKITVVDPDPPPTIQHLLDTWLTTSAVGSIDTRQRFIDRHVAKNVDVIIEILLRVIRTGNNASHHHANPTPLIVQQAATLHAPYPEQQTQVSLAVLGLYRLSIETALEAGIAVDKVIKKATDIVRSLPYRLAFGALDAIYKDEHPN